MEEEFRGKKVFITGASRGIGKTIKEMLEDKGALVCAPLRQELDLANVENVNEYLSLNQDSSYDIMIFCAGINRKAPIELLTDDNLQETFQVNLFSSIKIIQYYIEKMKMQSKGKIIFISSLYAIVSKEERISYSCSKNAVTGLVKTLALECAKSNICVNAVAPGYVLTEMTYKNLTEDEIENIRKNIPMNRLQDKEEIAELVLFLASDKNKSITGQLISVDGGFLCR